MRGRVDWIDAARGIGIVLVVLGHAERGLRSAGIATSPLWSTVDLAIYSFHMPLFMLLSGINIPGSLTKGRETFLKGKLATVLWPYVLWSLIQGSVLVALSGMTNSQADWSSLAEIAWKPISPFWYLYALFAFMVIVAITGVRALLLVPLGIAGLALSGRIADGGFLHQMAYMLPFFVIGALCSEAIKGLRLAPVTIALFAVLWVPGFLFMRDAQSVSYLMPAAFPAALAGIALVFALAQALDGAGKTLFVRLGQWSMSIYVMHVLGTAGARIVMAKAGVPNVAGIYLVACMAVGIVGPIIVHLVLERLGLLAVFGLGKDKPAAGKAQRRARAA